MIKPKPYIKSNYDRPALIPCHTGGIMSLNADDNVIDIFVVVPLIRSHDLYLHQILRTMGKTK